MVHAMPKATWQRTLTITAAQLREEAVLTDQAAREQEPVQGETLRTAARAYREAARLLDDAQALIGGALAVGR